ncbi:hypothetical protein LAZ67_6001512 [Cordylochernes scorpioides]|uniref:RRM domain-containing protein n=1 Tax=Cordylochernes scorpioides TaxID=51811 RepID=A0ABY6KL27_9ARAC|nr:hypothetical protein LAZ67_6001512 [Cordylochernes scorpioides]
MSGKLFVKNIPYNTSDEHFKEFFNQFGEVIEARIVREESGRSKGFGFVTFSTQGAANALIESDEILELENRKLIIRASVSKVTRPLNSEICVKNLPFETTDDQFFEFFGTFGLVQKACVICKASGESRGFGYVTFNEEKAANALIEKKNLIVLKEQKLVIEVPPRNGQISKDIFVINLPFDTTNEKLCQYFSTFGEVAKAKVICSASGQSKGFGFVTFSNKESAKALFERKEPLILGRKRIFVEASIPDKTKTPAPVSSKPINSGPARPVPRKPLATSLPIQPPSVPIQLQQSLSQELLLPPNKMKSSLTTSREVCASKALPIPETRTHPRVLPDLVQVRGGTNLFQEG